MVRRRKKLKWEPVCHWCKQDMTDTGWRTPLFSKQGDFAQGFLAGIVICGEDCPKRPEGAQVYHKDEL